MDKKRQNTIPNPWGISESDKGFLAKAVDVRFVPQTNIAPPQMILFDSPKKSGVNIVLRFGGPTGLAFRWRDLNTANHV